MLKYNFEVPHYLYFTELYTFTTLYFNILLFHFLAADFVTFARSQASSIPAFPGFMLG